MGHVAAPKRSRVVRVVVFLFMKTAVAGRNANTSELWTATKADGTNTAPTANVEWMGTEIGGNPSGMAALGTVTLASPGKLVQLNGVNPPTIIRALRACYGPGDMRNGQQLNATSLVE